MRHSSTRPRPFSVALVATVAVVAPIVAAQSPASSDEIDDARTAVEDVAERYFAAEVGARRLDDEIFALEQQLADAEARAARVRADAEARAVAIYKGSTADLVTVFGGEDALEAARRVQLVDVANADANDSFDRLVIVADDLEARHAELESARQTQTALLEELDAEQRSLEAELASVQAAWRAEQARRATTPSSSSAPGSTDASTRLAPSSETTDAPDTNPPATDSAPTSEPEPAPAPEPTPAPPPPTSGEHPHHDDPFLVCTRTRESGGNYQAENPNGIYFGAYQFALQTWDSAATHAGRYGLIGVVPSQASVYDQDDMAWTLYQWQGKEPWLGLC